MNATLFVALLPLAWGLPTRSWPAIAQLLAACHLAVRGIFIDRADHGLGTPSAKLRREILAGNYEETLLMLREHRPGGWKRPIRIAGLENLERAVESKRGVVLWVAACNFAELAVKKALRSADYAIVNLRSDVHPYSGTRFGRVVLNRIRTSVENRFLSGTVTLGPWDGAKALLELRRALEHKRLVTITANAEVAQPYAIPMFGGVLHLALGAPTLARIARAPLLPVFTCKSAGEIVVEIGPILNADPALRGRKADEFLARAFALELESFLARTPSSWRGWLAQFQYPHDLRLEAPLPTQHESAASMPGIGELRP